MIWSRGRGRRIGNSRIVRLPLRDSVLARFREMRLIQDLQNLPRGNYDSDTYVHRPATDRVRDDGILRQLRQVKMPVHQT